MDYIKIITYLSAIRRYGYVFIVTVVAVLLF